MAYRVEIARRAEADLEELYLWSSNGRRSRAPDDSTVSNARSCRWTSIPKRCPVAPENIDTEHPVRVLSYGRKPHTYRVFFTVDVDAGVVHVLHVRRGARQRPSAAELRGDQAGCVLLTRSQQRTSNVSSPRALRVGGTRRPLRSAARAAVAPGARPSTPRPSSLRPSGFDQLARGRGPRLRHLADARVASRLAPITTAIVLASDVEHYCSLTMRVLQFHRRALPYDA